MSYAEAQYTIDEVLSGVKGMQIAGNEPANLANIKILGGDGHCFLSWTPQDTVIDGQVVTTVVGVIIRRKEGDFPNDENDGVLVGDFTGAELYKYISQHFTDEGLTNGVTYYYRFFPYTAYGMMNRSFDNRATGTPQDATRWGFHQNFLDKNPDTCITYLDNATGYTPMMTNTDNGTHTYGSWENWDWFKRIKPFLVKASTGVAASSINETDYGKDRGGNNITYSNSSNMSDFDYFAWLPKIYMKEIYAADGNSRDVYFALDTEGECYDYKPIGFYNKAGEEVEGLFIPMFYPNSVSNKPRSMFKAQFTSGANTIPGWISEIQNRWGSRGVAFGGPILNLIRDMLYMLYRTTDIQKVAGYGNSINKTSSSSSTTTQNNQYYGTYKANWGGGKSASYQTTRMFHSNILGGCFSGLIDPYLVCVGGQVHIAKDYNSNPSDLSGYTSVYGLSYSTSVVYPSKLVFCKEGYGSLPASYSDPGSTTTGLCDSVRASSGNRAAVRIGLPSSGDDAGQAYLYAFRNLTDTDPVYSTFVAPMVIPDVGYVPNWDTI